MIRIGLTGGVASGKSTALSIFKNLGCATFSSDDVVHKLFEKNSKIVAMIKNQFGCVDDFGRIDRKRLGKMVFNSKDKREKLENIIHPAVKSIRREFFMITEKKGILFAVCETPLLFEKKLTSEFDYSVVITAGLDIRVERFLNSNPTGRSQDDFFEISRNQINDSKKIALADFVIKNNGSFDELKFKIKSVLEVIKRQKGF